MKQLISKETKYLYFTYLSQNKILVMVSLHFVFLCFQEHLSVAEGSIRLVSQPKFLFTVIAVQAWMSSLRPQWLVIIKFNFGFTFSYTSNIFTSKSVAERCFELKWISGSLKDRKFRTLPFLYVNTKRRYRILWISVESMEGIHKNTGK